MQIDPSSMLVFGQLLEKFECAYRNLGQQEEPPTGAILIAFKTYLEGMERTRHAVETATFGECSMLQALLSNMIFTSKKLMDRWTPADTKGPRITDYQGELTDVKQRDIKGMHSTVKDAFANVMNIKTLVMQQPPAQQPAARAGADEPPAVPQSVDAQQQQRVITVARTMQTFLDAILVYQGGGEGAQRVRVIAFPAAAEFAEWFRTLRALATQPEYTFTVAQRECGLQTLHRAYMGDSNFRPFVTAFCPNADAPGDVFFQFNQVPEHTMIEFTYMRVIAIPLVLAFFLRDMSHDLQLPELTIPYLILGLGHREYLTRTAELLKKWLIKTSSPAHHFFSSLEYTIKNNQETANVARHYRIDSALVKGKTDRESDLDRVTEDTRASRRGRSENQGGDRQSDARPTPPPTPTKTKNCYYCYKEHKLEDPSHIFRTCKRFDADVEAGGERAKKAMAFQKEALKYQRR